MYSEGAKSDVGYTGLIKASTDCVTALDLPSPRVLYCTVRNTTLYGADTFAVMRGTTNGVKKNYAIINISYGHAL